MGTPQTSSAGSDKIESSSTIKLLLVRYDLNQAIVDGEKVQKYHFSKKNFKINCVKCFLKIYEDHACMQTLIASFKDAVSQMC